MDVILYDSYNIEIDMVGLDPPVSVAHHSNEEVDQQNRHDHDEHQELHLQGQIENATTALADCDDEDSETLPMMWSGVQQKGSSLYSLMKWPSDMSNICSCKSSTMGGYKK